MNNLHLSKNTEFQNTVTECTIVCGNGFLNEYTMIQNYTDQYKQILNLYLYTWE